MVKSKEASARIKINKLLEESGWCFEDKEWIKANIQLEPGVKYADLGDDFQNDTHGFIDFLLLDKDGRPLVVVEAKKASIDPFSAKEQARNYARNCWARFVILSNGNIHYLWDTQHGNPDTITRFPSQDSITQYEKYIPNSLELASTKVDENYVIYSQMPWAEWDPDFQNESTRSGFLKKNNLKQLRPYQVQAIKALQEAAKVGSQRFLFEMATGTGKTLTSSAVIKLFLKSGNARRVLFLVDRLELEDQAVHTTTESGESINETFNERHFERKIFNEETNIAMCKALIENGLFDPVAKKLWVNLFGKTIVFCVSQNHAARVTNIFNKMAFEKWPNQYGESNFAMQVSSQVSDAQQMTINFANNRLGGTVNQPEGYDSSKTRIAVTVDDYWLWLSGFTQYCSNETSI